MFIFDLGSNIYTLDILLLYSIGPRYSCAADNSVENRICYLLLLFGIFFSSFSSSSSISPSYPPLYFTNHLFHESVISQIFCEISEHPPSLSPLLLILLPLFFHLSSLFSEAAAVLGLVCVCHEYGAMRPSYNKHKHFILISFGTLCARQA